MCLEQVFKEDLEEPLLLESLVATLKPNIFDYSTTNVIYIGTIKSQPDSSLVKVNCCLIIEYSGYEFIILKPITDCLLKHLTHRLEIDCL